MGTRQVLDVNIVADRGPIGCGIVGSVDLNLGTLPGGRLKYEWDQVCLSMMILSQSSTGPCNVEIAQADRRKTMGCGFAPNHLVHRHPGPSIRIRRLREGCLWTRDLSRDPIHCG